MTARAVAFESIDVANDPGGMAALQALGLRTVPVVAAGERYVFGQSLRDVAAFLGIDDTESEQLTPAVLAARLDRVLEVAIRLCRQIPDGRIDDKLPNRDRSYKELGHHVFVVADAFFDTVEGHRLTTERLAVAPPLAMRTGGDVADFGAAVRRRAALWWDRAAAEDFSRLVSTYYDDQTLHDVLERTTWHAAQHVRQLDMVLTGLDLVPVDRLTPEDLHGLPLPSQVWDS